MRQMLRVLRNPEMVKHKMTQEGADPAVLDEEPGGLGVVRGGGQGCRAGGSCEPVRARAMVDDADT